MDTQEIRGFEGEYRFLSNFFASPIKITYHDVDYVMPTGEHAFHAMKICAAINMTAAQESDFLQNMSHFDTPNKAKRAGRSIRIDVDKWNAVSTRCMQRVTELKYEQNPALRLRLMQTAPKILIEENTWGDRLWGTVNGQGSNLLGKILMAHRKNLIETTSKGEEL